MCNKSSFRSNTFDYIVLKMQYLYYYCAQEAKNVKNSAIRNCCISAREEIRLHPFGTSAERIKACILKGCNFIAPRALIQQFYY